MDVDLETKILNCKNDIAINNKLIADISKKNERLFNSLMSMLNTLPVDKKERYDKELASDNWKKYSKIFQLF